MQVNKTKCNSPRQITLSGVTEKAETSCVSHSSSSSAHRRENEKNSLKNIHICVQYKYLKKAGLYTHKTIHYETKKKKFRDLVKLRKTLCLCCKLQLQAIFPQNVKQALIQRTVSSVWQEATLTRAHSDVNSHREKVT